MFYIRPNFDAALLNFRLILKLGPLEVENLGQVAPPLSGPANSMH